MYVNPGLHGPPRGHGAQVKNLLPELVIPTGKENHKFFTIIAIHNYKPKQRCSG